MVEYNVDWLIVIYYETMGEKKEILDGFVKFDQVVDVDLWQRFLKIRA